MRHIWYKAPTIQFGIYYRDALTGENWLSNENFIRDGLLKGNPFIRLGYRKDIIKHGTNIFQK